MGRQRGAPRSRAINAATAARLPPALSPPTTIRLASPPSARRCAAAHWADRENVLGGRRPRVFRGQPVARPKPQRPGIRFADAAAQSVVTVQVAEHETAAVGIHQDRQRTRRSPPDGRSAPRCCRRPVAIDASLTSPTSSGLWAGTKRDRIVARACAPVIVCTGGKSGVQRFDHCPRSGGRDSRTACPGRGCRRGAAGCSVGDPRGPSSTSRQMPIAVIRTGAARRWSNVIRLIGPHTDTAATASPGAPIGAATQPKPASDSSRSNATPWARTLASSSRSWAGVLIEYLVLRVASRRPRRCR